MIRKSFIILVTLTGLLVFFNNCAQDLDMPAEKSSPSLSSVDSNSNSDTNTNTMTQASQPSLTSDRYEMYTGQTTQLNVSGGLAPYIYSVSPQSGGSVNSDTLVYTANQPGTTGITVTDQNGNSSSISIAQTQPPANCTTPWGASVAHGNSVTAYKSSSASTCTSQTRTCDNGTLSGSYAYQSCSVSVYNPCDHVYSTADHDACVMWRNNQ